MDKSAYVKILNWVKKIKCFEFLQSYECKMCGEKDIVKLCFHHIDSAEKEKGISKMRYQNLKKITDELIKCEVLCQNCHQEIHQRKDVLKSSEFKIKNKKLFINFLNKKEECEICGYNKCIDCLNFHHTGNKTIEFRLFRNKLNNISDIAENIKNELVSCKILCRNCHESEHSKFFEKNKEIILKKAKTFKGNQSKLPIEDVIKMYEDGMKQIEISRKFNASKSTISGIIKKYYQLLA